VIPDVERRLGCIDVLVNNAGTAVARGLDDITEEEFDRVIASFLDGGEFFRSHLKIRQQGSPRYLRVSLAARSPGNFARIIRGDVSALEPEPRSQILLRPAQILSI